MIKNLFSNFGKDIAIDLGTANTLVYVKGEGIVIREPSVVALNQKTGKILAIGQEAKKMIGRTPSHILAIKPLRNGVISDFEVAEQMLRYFIQKSYKRNIVFPRPRIIIGIPCGLTDVERRAVRDAAKNTGAKSVFLVEQPMASAIGARLPVNDPGGNFVVDIGGGTTEIAVISLGGIVLSKSLKIAGDKLNDDIINYVQEEYRLLIGERTAEQIKMHLGSACHVKEKEGAPVKKELPMRGRNLITGLPEEVIITQDDVRRSLEKSIKEVVMAVKDTIEATPPELVSDIMTKNIYLSGGGALLKGIDVLISKETRIPTKIVEDPLTAVVRGAGMVLENLEIFKDVLTQPQEVQIPQ